MLSDVLLNKGRRISVIAFPQKAAENATESAPRGRSACTACAYLINPIAAENCGFSKAEVSPDIVCACATRAGNFENFLGQMIDAVQMAAAAGDENAFADVVDERILPRAAASAARTSRAAANE